MLQHAYKMTVCKVEISCLFCSMKIIVTANYVEQNAEALLRLIDFLTEWKVISPSIHVRFWMLLELQLRRYCVIHEEFLSFLEVQPGELNV